MKDLLLAALCGLLVLVGIVIGHGFAVTDAIFFDSVEGFTVGAANIVAGSVIAFFVSRFFYKKSGDDLKLTAEKLEAATNRILDYQDQRDKGFDVDVVQDGNERILRKNLTNIEEIAATGYVDSIIMTRTVEKADP